MARKIEHRVVIATHRPWRRFGIVGGAAMALLLGGWALYSYTRATTVSDFERARSERDELVEDRRRLTRELRAAQSEAEQTKDQLAYLSRSQEIDEGACASVRKSISGLQEQNADLREQLAFYRGIVSPQESQAGVRVYEFKLSRNPDPNLYRFDLVLIQSVRHDKRLAGTIDVIVEGLQAGQKQQFKLSEAMLEDRKNLLFSFRYFQEFSGTFRIPDGMRPLRATVRIQPDGDSPEVEDEYDWSKIMQEVRTS